MCSKLLDKIREEQKDLSIMENTTHIEFPKGTINKSEKLIPMNTYEILGNVCLLRLTEHIEKSPIDSKDYQVTIWLHQQSRIKELKELLKEACRNLDPSTYSGVTDVRIFLKREDVQEAIK